MEHNIRQKVKTIRKDSLLDLPDQCIIVSDLTLSALPCGISRTRGPSQRV